MWCRLHVKKPKNSYSKFGKLGGFHVCVAICLIKNVAIVKVSAGWAGEIQHKVGEFGYEFGSS